jgi:hypothetical protein
MEIDKITTLPDLSAVSSVRTDPSVKKIKLPEHHKGNPLVYVPVAIHMEKAGGIALALLLALVISACTLINAGMLIVHQIIIVK